VRVDIWSDLVCPWCYVGKRRFERALDRFPHRDQVQTVHRAFQLNPGIPKGETSKRQDVLRSKYALSQAEADALDARMAQTAAADGLEYNLSGILTGNTADAHRLLHLAQEHQLQADVLERLYRAYFTEKLPSSTRTR
jgi:predicted DsbA family dithiol-disulfide isomerase